MKKKSPIVIFLFIIFRNEKKDYKIYRIYARKK